MPRSLSTKAFFAILAAVIFAVAVIGAVYKYVEQGWRLRMHAAMATGGDPKRGEAMFIEYGCGSCHSVRGVRTATGQVGPPLDNIGVRVIIAGHLANNPANMESWIRDPQHVSPGTAMPDLHVGEGDARDITAFLYTRTK
jgi:cytochrome c2